MSIVETQLSQLNVLRQQAGKAPLKSWKESTAKLEAAIAAAKADVLAKSAADTREKREADAIELQKAEAKLPKPTPAKPTAPVNVKELQDALARSNKPVTKLPAAKANGLEKDAPKAKVKVVEHEINKRTETKGTQSSEASIAAERLGMSPKAVRAKLRKLNHRAGHGLSADQIVKAIKA